MKDIDVLEEMKKEWIDARQSRLAEPKEYGEGLKEDVARDDRYIKTLDRAISVLKELEETDGELPKAKFYSKGATYPEIYRKKPYQVGNEIREYAINECRIPYLKLKQENKKLKQTNSEYEVIFRCHTVAKLEQRLKDLEKELDNWKYELADFTKEKVATPKGVASFIKELLTRIHIKVDKRGTK